ncbi:hypothetical protein H109_00824 [Trichophyton interdigitale MR816]|uniref:C2H2-type domain-containing protein n=1 Tax=Trichophyton interdigitale (strain MR816) TaxID=1215338 RepID=A0A059JI91_TRIIM|nr:hypothetical protein H109_00824 [Trichophyton interdigitale MR816]
MDMRLTSTPSIFISDSAAEQIPARHRYSNTRNSASSSSYISSSTGRQQAQPPYSDSTPPSPSYGPMAIPRSQETIAPPPLPPPRFIEELANGHDSGWRWGNTFHPGGPGVSGAAAGPAGTEMDSRDTSTSRDTAAGTMLPPINPGSSLFGGGHARPPLRRRDETFRLDADEQRAVDARRPGSASMSEHETALGPRSAPLIGSYGDGNAFSPTSPLTRPSRSLSQTGSLSHTLDTRILPSTRQKPLSEKSVEHSINAYDRNLLSKIGGPTSPPRNAVLGLTTTPRDPTRVQTSFSALTLTDETLSPQDMRWGSGPPSAGISPGTGGSGFSDYIAFRNQREGSSSGPSPMEVDQFSQAREKYAGGISSGPVRYGEAAHSLPLHSGRRSHDRSFFPDLDTEMSMDEAHSSSVHSKTTRQRSLGERMPSYTEGISPLSNHGMKRRASSPPQVARHEDAALSSSSSGDRRMSGFPFNNGICMSPGGARYQSSHGSISSISSASMRTGSYASSTGLSVGASSMSSYDRPSPGGISPTDVDHYDRGGFISSPAQKQSTSAPILSMPRPAQYPEPSPTSAADMKKNSISAGSGRKGSHTCPNSSKNPQRVGRSYICDCCHTKPKKLDSLEELRAHEMEKQYNCNYCHKRFKNKNEAERHRASLHIRHHSWSCGSLSGYESAFHPSSSSSNGQASGSTTSTHDTCGFCGMEFPNLPAPQWDVRIEHLTSVHKFGECNQSKKFWRADHLRQHLKHIHAGSSGKWTNILENACMREEPIADPGLPSIGETPDGKMETDMMGHDGDGES